MSDCEFFDLGWNQFLGDMIELTPDQIEGSWQLQGGTPSATRVLFPALVNDGAKDLETKTEGAKLEAAKESAL